MSVLWVAEPIAHGDHTLNVTGGFDDVAADHAAFRCSLNGHDTVRDPNGDAGWVAQEHAHDEILADLALYVRVGPAVHTQHVGAGHDADQCSVVAGDRESRDPPRVHQPGRLGDRLVRADRHRWTGHQLGCGDRAGPGVLALRHHALGHPGHGALECLLGQQVGPGDDPDDLVVVVEHGECADSLLAQHGRHVLVRGASPDGDHVGAHDVLDGGFHGCCLPFGRASGVLVGDDHDGAGDVLGYLAAARPHQQALESAG